MPESQAKQLINELKTAGVETAVKIGEVILSPNPHIRVI
jgi:hypothetical protein